MLGSVFAKSLYDQRRAVIGWSVGIIALALLVATAWPIVRDQPAFGDLVESYPEALLRLLGVEDAADYLTPSGYLGAQLYSTYVPLLLLTFSIGYGARAIAGEEADGTLDLLLANPVSRARVVMQKLGALVGLVAILAAVLGVTVWVGGSLFSANPGAWEIASATISGALLAVLFGTLALAVGALTGQRTVALAVASGVAVAAYLAWGLAPLVSGMEWLQKFSPFWYYLGGKPLTNGLDWGHAAVLVAATAVLVPVALWGFGRRDVAV